MMERALSPFQKSVLEEALRCADLFLSGNDATDSLRKKWVSYAFFSSPFSERDEILEAYLRLFLSADLDQISGVRRGEKQAMTAIGLSLICSESVDGDHVAFWGEVDRISPDLYTMDERVVLRQTPNSARDFVWHLINFNQETSLAVSMKRAVDMAKAAQTATTLTL